MRFDYATWTIYTNWKIILRLPSTSSNQQLTLWPSIGHYSSRISPIVEVEEHPTTTVASSTQAIATISHGGELIPSPVSPPLYQESVIWNTASENIPIQQDDHLIQLHYENQIQTLSFQTNFKSADSKIISVTIQINARNAIQKIKIS